MRGYAETFEQRGDRYHAAMSRCPEARRDEFAAVVAAIRPRAGDRVLDAPAGGGYLGEHLPVGVSYLAIDGARAFAERCAERDCTVLGDTVALPVADGCCDAVCSVAGLHHLGERLPAYREFERVLAPGGRLAVLEVAIGSPEARFLNDFVDRHNPDGHQGRFLGPADADLMARAGLGGIACTPLRYVWRFRSREEAIAYCSDLFGLTCSSEVVGAELEQGLGLSPGETGWRLPWGLTCLVARAVRHGADAASRQGRRAVRPQG